MKISASYFDPVFDSNGNETGVDLEVSLWTGDGQFISKTIERINRLPTGVYSDGIIKSAIERAKARLLVGPESKDFGEALRRVNKANT